MTNRTTISLVAGLIAITAPPAHAQSAGGSTTEKKPFGYAIARRVSDVELPFTQEDSELSLSFSPKIGDVLHEPYIRLPLNLEYGFTDKREGRIGYTPLVENPFDSNGEFSKGHLSLGFKQRIDPLLDDRVALAVGFDARWPIDYIPNAWARDSYDTYSPYIVAAYELEPYGEWTVFTHLRYDLLDKDSHHWIHGGEVPNSLATISPGVVYNPGGDFRYAFEIRYVTDGYDGGDNSGLKFIPSITWYPPSDTRFFKSIVGDFELTLSVEYTESRLPEQRDESDIGVSLDIKWDLFREIKRPKTDLTE